MSLKVLDKAIKVVNSCKTREHLNMAYQYINIAYNKRYLDYTQVSHIYKQFVKIWKAVNDEPPPCGPAPPTTAKAYHQRNKARALS